MSITPKTPGIHHIALRCSDMNTTKNFYQNILGLPLPLDTPDLMGFVAGSVFIVFKKHLLFMQRIQSLHPLT